MQDNSFFDVTKRHNVPVNMLTTFGGVGSVGTVYYPKSKSELVWLIAKFENEQTAYFVIGGGSNTIVSSCTKRVFICTKYMDKIEFCDNLANVECGANMAQLIAQSVSRGLAGLEFLAGVPCSVGGAVAVNAGAFGGQISDLVQWVDILDQSKIANYGVEQKCEQSSDSDIVKSLTSGAGIDRLGVDEFNLQNRLDAHEIALAKRVNDGVFNFVKRLGAHEIDFGYRKGVIGLVLSVQFEFNKSDDVYASELIALNQSMRRAKQPRARSCGSVFKNVQSDDGVISAGKLIDSLNLKGTRVGGAQISLLHANFIINLGSASAEDFCALVDIARTRVFDKYGIMLDTEFVFVD